MTLHFRVILETKFRGREYASFKCATVTAWRNEQYNATAQTCA